MESRNLDLAAEFCKLVSKPDLLAYLGLSSDATATEARERLKARRRRMQGMQGNPKYKREAIFLIKHVTALDKVLQDTDAYLVDATRRAESVHLPILEMTIKGVLGAGTLTGDQEDYLRRNAMELGVTEETFEAMLDRLAEEAGVPRQRSAPVKPLQPEERVDFYRLFGVDATADRDEIERAYEQKLQEARQIRDAVASDRVVSRVQLAWRVLSDAEARAQYDLSSSRTGPPARNRQARPAEAATAPPVRQRARKPTSSSSPHDSPSGAAPGRLEVFSDPTLAVRLGATPSSCLIDVGNGGALPLEARVESNQPWASVEPGQLDPDAKNQQITVTLDPASMPARQGTAVVFIDAGTGGSAEVRLEVQRGTDPLLLAAAALGGLLLLLVVAAVAWSMASPA